MSACITRAKTTTITTVPKTPRGRRIHACLNGEVLAHQPYAVTTLITLTEHSVPHLEEYMLSAAKLGASMASRAITYDMLLLAAVDPGLENLLHMYALHIKHAGWKLCVIPTIASSSFSKNNGRFQRAKLYSKLQAWNLDEYNAVAVLDADMLAVGDVGELFSVELPRMHDLSIGAVRDFPQVGDEIPPLLPWIGQCLTMPAGTFNAGLLLLRPSRTTFSELVEAIDTVEHNRESCEQALLNVVFANRTYPLPFRYNVNLVTKTCFPSLYQQTSAVLLHYTVAKPWGSRDLYSSIFWSCQWWGIKAECDLWQRQCV